MNVADLKGDSETRWVESPSHQQKPRSFNNNTIDLLSQTLWKDREMPMLLQQPQHVLLHEAADQPLDFTMSKFKSSTNATSHHLKQFNTFAAQQMMLLQNNGLYFNRGKGYARTTSSSPSSSSEEEGVGPPIGSPRSPPTSPKGGVRRADGKSHAFRIKVIL